MTINVCMEFGSDPGRMSGGGAEFLDRVLDWRYMEARRLGDKLVVDLDGGFGYPMSFIRDAFGGLAGRHCPLEVSSTVEVKSEDEPGLAGDVERIICCELEKCLKRSMAEGRDCVGGFSQNRSCLERLRGGGEPKGTRVPRGKTGKAIRQGIRRTVEILSRMHGRKLRRG